jgi:hypothetical protein
MQRLAKVIAALRHRLDLSESEQRIHRAISESYFKALLDATKSLQNWRRKATRIAAALGTRDDETLVQSAERTAGEAKTARCQIQYADLIKRVEAAEVERTEAATRAAAWQGHAEQLAADFYRPILAALGISDALSFAGAREQVIAKFKEKEATPCACTPRPEPPKCWD